MAESELPTQDKEESEPPSYAMVESKLPSPAEFSKMHISERNELIQGILQYDPNNKWFQYKNPSSANTTVIINPAADHNGAFADSKPSVAQMVGLLDSSVIVARVGSTSELSELIDRLPENIDFIQLGGHGSPSSQQFGEESFLSVDDLKNNSLITDKLNKKLSPNATILIRGCSTGSFAVCTNYAEQMAHNLNASGGSRKIVAPIENSLNLDLVTSSIRMKDIRFKHITVWGDEGVQHGEDYSLVVNPKRNLPAKPLYEAQPEQSEFTPKKAYSISGSDLQPSSSENNIKTRKILEYVQSENVHLGSLRLNDIRDEEAVLGLGKFNPGQVEWLRIEGLAQTSSADVFIEALRVAKTKLACNCDFSLKALESGPPQPSTLEHLDVRSVTDDNGQSGGGLKEWDKFSNLKRLGADASFILNSAKNSNLERITVYGNEIGDISKMVNGQSLLERIIRQAPGAKKMSFEIDARDKTDFQELLNSINAKDGVGTWRLDYKSQNRVEFQRTS